MEIVITSASGANGEGLGAVLRFGLDGRRNAPFPKDAGIVDPRGLHIHPDGEHLYVNSGDNRVLLLDTVGSVTAATPTIRDLNPGGGVVAPDGRYCVGSRTMGTLLAFPPDLGSPGELLLPRGVAAFPRGFAFAPDRRLFLAAGASAAGLGAGRIWVGTSNRNLELLIEDPELSPLDLTLAPNGNVLVSSEFPFGSPSASERYANTTPTTASSSASSHLMRPFRFGDQEDFGFLPKAAFVALRATRSSPSTSRRRGVSALLSALTGCTDRRSNSFHELEIRTPRGPPSGMAAC